MKRLNLGCGLDIRKGWVNLDIIKRDGVDVVHNLDKYPYPFKDGEFDEVHANHLFEHVDDMLMVFEELHRILKPGGVIVGRVPYYTSSGAFQDPTHKHFFADDTLKYYIINNGYDRKFKFELVYQRLIYTMPFKFNPLRGVLRHFLFNVVSELTFAIRKRR